MLKFFAWLWSIFTSRKAERELFAFFDGEKTRHIDPLVAWRSIWGHREIDLSSEVKISANLTLADGKTAYTAEEVYAAEDRIRQLTREVFGLKAWTEAAPGLTVAETDKVLADFLDYMEGLKKKRKTLPMMSRPSDSKPQLDSTASAAAAPITSPSASGSIASESSDAAPSGS